MIYLRKKKYMNDFIRVAILKRGQNPTTATYWCDDPQQGRIPFFNTF